MAIIGARDQEGGCVLVVEVASVLGPSRRSHWLPSQLLAVRTIKDNRRFTYNLHFGAVPLDPGPLEMSVIDLSPLDVQFTQTTLGPIVASVDAGALPAVSPAPTDNFWDSASRGRDTAVLYACMHC